MLAATAKQQMMRIISPDARYHVTRAVYSNPPRPQSKLMLTICGFQIRLMIRPEFISLDARAKAKHEAICRRTSNFPATFHRRR